MEATNEGVSARTRGRNPYPSSDLAMTIRWIWLVPS